MKKDIKKIKADLRSYKKFRRLVSKLSREYYQDNGKGPGYLYMSKHINKIVRAKKRFNQEIEIKSDMKNILIWQGLIIKISKSNNKFYIKVK